MWYFEESRFRALVDNIDQKRVYFFTASGKRYKSLCVDELTYETCTKNDAKGLIKNNFKYQIMIFNNCVFPVEHEEKWNILYQSLSKIFKQKVKYFYVMTMKYQLLVIL